MNTKRTVSIIFLAFLCLTFASSAQANKRTECWSLKTNIKNFRANIDATQTAIRKGKVAVAKTEAAQKEARRVLRVAKATYVNYYNRISKGRSPFVPTAKQQQRLNALRVAKERAYNNYTEKVVTHELISTNLENAQNGLLELRDMLRVNIAAAKQRGCKNF